MLCVISIWAPLIYQYGVGGIIFLVGLAFALRSRACDLRRRADRFWLAVVLGGMAAYFLVHLTVYLLAIYVLPYHAGGAG